MSEIPKLETFSTYGTEIHCDDGNSNLDEEYKFKAVSIRSLKEVNTFWDKYKDNPMLFFKDFPKEQKDNAISNIRMNIEMKWISCKVNNIDFKDWLHDLLYKVE